MNYRYRHQILDFQEFQENKELQEQPETGQRALMYI